MSVTEELNPKLNAPTFYGDDKSWESYKTDFNKVYANSAEEALRKFNWANSVEEMNKHNELYVQGIHSWAKGINQFSDGTRPGKGFLPRPNKLKTIETTTTTILSSDAVQFYDASDKSWAEYKVKFDKNYTLAEEPQR